MEMVTTNSNTESRLASLQEITTLPVIQQIGRLFGIAAAVALGVAVMLWLREPGYTPLFHGMAQAEAAEVAQLLEQRNIPYRLDESTGALMVPGGDVRKLRLELAAEGYPKSSGVGLEVLQQKQDFGTSQFIQTTRYQHALEEELARSIITLSAVRNARVHLALPKQSVFVRKKQKPSASVLLELYAGRTLEAEQVAAITHMVAAGIPNLESERVTLVDQSGRLLSKPKGDSEMALNQEQFDYTRRLEESYVARIEDILGPVIGYNGLRAQVSAEMDFTVTEQTMETYNPDLPALRSEQVSEERNMGAGAQGVPGALSNQPPGDAVAPETLDGQGATEEGRTLNTRRNSTVNYELDRTISHSRQASGRIERLSVAVVVDDRLVTNADGEVVRQPRSAEELERLTALVREAVGYNAQRGDSVNLINAAFADPEAIPELPELPVWEQPWVIEYAKAGGALLVLLALIFGVLRPLIRNLSAPPAAAAGEAMALPGGGSMAGGEGMSEDKLSLSGPSENAVELPRPGAYEENIKLVQDVVKDDPKLVAQVVRNWIAQEH